MSQSIRTHGRLILPLALLWGCGLVNPAGAVDFSLGGFGTLGAARSSDETAEFVRDLSQPNGLTERWSLDIDSVLGIQADLGLGTDWRAAIQAVSRYHHDGSYTPEITWAFLGFTPTPAWTFRAGRLGTEFYMLSDSRMVGYSYTTVRPPIDYYGTLPFNYVDGMDVAAATPLAGGLLKGKLYAGVSREQSPWEDMQFNMSGSLLLGGYLDYLKGAWQVRLGHARVRFGSELPIEEFYGLLPAATADELRVKDRWTLFNSLGIAYDDGPLQVQLMLSNTYNEHATFEDTWAGYLILGYRVREWTPFIGLSAAKSSAKDLDYPIAGYTDTYQSFFHTDQRTLLLGARWDFRENMALKAQVDMIRGRPESTFLYRWENSDWDGSMNVFSLSLDLVF